MKLLLCSLMLLCVSLSFSQAKDVHTGTHSEDPNSNTTENINQLLTELNGTFQLQIHKADYRPFITAELLNRVKNERLTNTDVNISIDTYITLFIPSENAINSTSFTPLVRELYVGSTHVESSAK